MKLIIPAILVSVILLSGLFAFAPIQNASTVHETIGNSYAISELQKTLPAAGTVVSWTITCSDTGNMISGIWADNSATDNAFDPDFEVTALTIAGSTFKSGALTVAPSDVNVSGVTGEDVFDIMRLIEAFTNGPVGYSPMPCPAGDTVVISFDDNGSGDDTILNLIVAINGADGAILS